tara:strand:- start:65 stop:673 length:609 start_codon:yes stop_codon:yes gene_type:complete
MLKYLKVIINIVVNYKFYFVPVLSFELFFYIFHNKNYNKFKYLDSSFLSDSIPCPYFFLKKIEKFMYKNKIDTICDLGSGYGKILYYFGKIKKKEIHGVEIEKEIFLSSKELICNNIRIFNENILKFNLNQITYDAFILNDPLKNETDLMKLILNIKNSYNDVIIILINLDLQKQQLVKKELNILENFKASKNKNIFFCKIK